MKLNVRLINDPKAALEALMTITAALYTGVNRNASTQHKKDWVSCGIAIVLMRHKEVLTTDVC